MHWQTAAVLLGIWSCGATVVDTAAEDDGGLAGVDVVLAAQDRLAALEEEDADAELLGLSLHPLGAGMAGYAGQARDFAARGAHRTATASCRTPRPTRRRRGLVAAGWS